MPGVPFVPGMHILHTGCRLYLSPALSLQAMSAHLIFSGTPWRMEGAPRPPRADVQGNRAGTMRSATGVFPDGNFREPGYTRREVHGTRNGMHRGE